MALTKKQELLIKKMPKIESKIEKSDDGKWLFHRTIITHVRPTAYYEAILNDAESTEDDFEALAVEA